MYTNEYMDIKCSIDGSLSCILYHSTECNLNLRMLDTIIKNNASDSLDVLLLDNTLTHIFLAIEEYKTLHQKVRSMLSLVKGDFHE